jgi:hypothetical protein
MRNYLQPALIVSIVVVALQAQPDRIGARIDSAKTVVLAGHIPAHARREYDQGPAPPSFPMPAVTIYFKPSASQQTALRQLLANQQNPASADYHKWLRAAALGVLLRRRAKTM